MAEKKGHVKISRKAYADDVFWNEERVFSKWEAWEDLIQRAAWADFKKAVGMLIIPLNRGEVLASIRFLSERWGWGKTKVHAFLRLLEDMDRIKAQRETGAGTVYLLVNYDRYNGSDEEEDSATGNGQPEAPSRIPEAVRDAAPKKKPEKPLQLHTGPTVDEQVSAIIISANRGMMDNADLDRPTPINTGHGTSRQVVHDWLSEGIGADVAASAVYNIAKAYKPREGNRQPHSMKYFDNAVRTEALRQQALESPAPGSPAAVARADRSEVGIWKAENPEELRKIEAETVAWLETQDSFLRASEGVKKTMLQDRIKEAIQKRIRDTIAKAVG